MEKLWHMARTLQHWDHWLAQQFLGHQLLAAEERSLSHFLSQHFGKHALLIGVPRQYPLLNTTPIINRALASPILHKVPDARCIEADLHELPILSGSIDLVILPHTLQFVDNPRQLLFEACRIVKPEGLIVVMGFNPYSLWGLRKFCTSHKMTPWNANFIRSATIKNWLQLADFKMEKHISTLFSPPISHSGIFKRLRFLEKIGKKCLPRNGGVYILLARAKVIPLTPIKLKWKQQLSGIRLPTSISGNIAR